MSEIMKNPVEFRCCNINIDKPSAQRLILDTNTCPYCRSKNLKSNCHDLLDLKKEIEAWTAKRIAEIKALKESGLDMDEADKLEM
jgi:hypothetical protein